MSAFEAKQKRMTRPIKKSKLFGPNKSFHRKEKSKYKTNWY